MSHIDTLKIYTDFIKAGCSDEMAHTIANCLNNLYREIQLNNGINPEYFDSVRVNLQNIIIEENKK